VKSPTRKPVVGGGHLASFDYMLQLIKSGQLNLAGAARPSIADPFLPPKIRNNRVDDIRDVHQLQSVRLSRSSAATSTGRRSIVSSTGSSRST